MYPRFHSLASDIRELRKITKFSCGFLSIGNSFSADGHPLDGDAVTNPASAPGRLPDHVPVLVAGGGPVGLATAMELAHHAVPSLVIEPRREVSWLRPRAKTTSARTMEHFRRWGLAKTVRHRAPLPVAWSDRAVFCTHLLGREITTFDRCFGLELAGSRLVAEPGQQVPQPLVEQVLREAVAASGDAKLFVGWTVSAVEELDDAVSVEVVDDHGETRCLSADYVVGCEGARSVVREAMGARYEGSNDSRPNFNMVFRAPGLAERLPHRPAVHYWVLDPDQPGIVGRLDLDETWWCGAQGVDADAGNVDPERIVLNLIGADADVEVLSTDSWRARMLLVDRYASRRLFVAGDSAHQNPPFGGHGFNTGVGDAVNIGWKLAAVHHGWAPPTLLESYEAERRPVAAETIAETVRNNATLAAELADPRLHGSDEEFDLAKPLVAASIQRSKDGEFHSLGLTLGYHYARSPIVAHEPAPENGGKDHSSYIPTAAPGHRFPHAWRGPDDSLYDHFGKGFALVCDIGSPVVGRFERAASELGLPLEVVPFDPAALPRLGAAAVLIRPDQHVAWRGDDAEDPKSVLRRAVGYPR